MKVPIRASQLRSRSKNTPFDGWELRGGVAATIIHGRTVCVNPEIGPTSLHMNRQDETRQRRSRNLQPLQVLMLDGHSISVWLYGRVYLNPHQLFRQPSTIWRFTQDLLDVLPGSTLEATEVVAGPATGGALLAQHDRRPARQPTRDYPATDAVCSTHRRPFGQLLAESLHQQQVKGRSVLLVDDVRNTGHTLSRCAAAVRAAGGTLLATADIDDRLEAVVDLDVPNFALADGQSTGELSCRCVSALRRRHAGDNVLRSGGSAFDCAQAREDPPLPGYDQHPNRPGSSGRRPSHPGTDSGPGEYERLSDEIVATEDGLRKWLFGERPAAEVVLAVR